MAGPTYFGSASNPADNVSQVGPGPLAVTPPASMVAGDFVRMMLAHRIAGQEESLSVPTAGGQTWYPILWAGTTALSVAVWCCTFNGTWSVNPQFQDDSGNAAPLICKMDVFRPSAAGKFIDIAWSPIKTDFVAGSSPFTKTVTGITTIIANEMVIADYISVDDNTWGSLTAGWTNAGGAQIRNPSGSGLSISTAYQAFASPGATGNVAENEATLGGDAGLDIIMSIYERDAPSTSVPPVDVFCTFENSTNGTAMTAAILNAGTTLAAASGTWGSPVGAGGPNLAVATAAQQGLGTRAFSVSAVNITDASGTRGMEEDNNNQAGAPYNFSWVKTVTVTKFSAFCWFRTGLPYGIFDSFTMLGPQDGAFTAGAFLSVQNFEGAAHRFYQESCASDLALLGRFLKDVTYGVTFLVDKTNNIGRMMIVDTSFNQIGFSTGLRLGTAPSNVDRMMLGSFGGNFPAGASYAGATTRFEDVAIDFTNALFPLLPQVASSAISGTLAQTLGALTSSGAGTVDVAGTLARTLGALTSVGTGTVAVSGQGAVTLGALTSTGAGTVTVDGTLAKTLGALVVAGVGNNGGAVSATDGYQAVEWRRRGRR